MADVLHRLKTHSITLALALSAGAISAAPTAPCSDIGSYTGPGGKQTEAKIIPIETQSHTYCSSAFGWSDSWFVGAPLTDYDGRKDVYSGEFAPMLRYSFAGIARQTNSGYLTPVMDRGTYAPSPVNGTAANPFQWAVASDVMLIAPNQTQSVLLHALDQIQLTVTTTVNGNEVAKQFTFANQSANLYDDLLFASYFNFHPNSTSTATGVNQGTTSFDAGNGICTSGNASRADFLANGCMKGDRPADQHAVGTARGTETVWRDLADGKLNGANGPVGPTDSAGALAWSLGRLAPGQSVSISTFESLAIGAAVSSLPGGAAAGSTTPTPEPPTLILVGAGIAIVAGHRRLRAALKQVGGMA